MNRVITQRELRVAVPIAAGPGVERVRRSCPSREDRQPAHQCHRHLINSMSCAIRHDDAIERLVHNVARIMRCPG
jgi:hypothetical protein